MKKKDIKELLGQTSDSYTRLRNDIKNKKSSRREDNSPVSTQDILYKSYARFEEIKLPKEKLGELSLKKALVNRASCRSYKNSPIPLSSLSTILKYSFGINENHRKANGLALRFYPSAGARFPLEIYVVVNNVQRIPRGVYHYYLPNHSLEKLFDNVTFEAKNIIVSPWFEKASCYIVITSIHNRTTAKYGGLGYRFVLNEAGFAGQNLYLVSQAVNVGCSSASYYDDELETLLGIDGKNESIALCFALGIEEGAL